MAALTRLALIIAAVVGIAFALHLVYGWRPAPRRDTRVRTWSFDINDVKPEDPLLGTYWLRAMVEGSPFPEDRVDRDAWPEGVGT